MIVGSAVFVLLFLGGWNPLPWLPLAHARRLAGPGAGRRAVQLAIAVPGILSIAIFLGKVLFMIFFFMWVRWTVPRFRYDQVMKHRLATPAPARHRQPRRLCADHRRDSEMKRKDSGQLNSVNIVAGLAEAGPGSATPATSFFLSGHLLTA